MGLGFTVGLASLFIHEVRHKTVDLWGGKHIHTYRYIYIYIMYAHPISTAPTVFGLPISATTTLRTYSFLALRPQIFWGPSERVSSA